MKRKVSSVAGRLKRNLPFLIPFVAGIVLAWVGWLLINLEVYGFDSRSKDFQLGLLELMSDDRSWNNDSWALLSSFVFNEYAVLAVWALALVMFLISAVIGTVRALKNTSPGAAESSAKKSATAFFSIATYTSFVMVAVFASIPLLVLDNFGDTVSRADREIKSASREQDSLVEELAEEVTANRTASLSAFSDWLEGRTAVTRAAIDCITSPNSRSYYSSPNSWVDSGFYNNCSLSEYLERRWDLIDEPNLERKREAAEQVLALSQRRLNQAELTQAKMQSDKTAVVSQSRFIDRTVATANEILLWSFIVLLFSSLGLALLRYSGQLVGFATRAKDPLVGTLKAGASRLKWESRSRTCPNCAERIKREARVCRHCGGRVDPLKTKT